MNKFKCVEGPEGQEHVETNKVTAHDVETGLVEFIEHFEIPHEGFDLKAIRKDLRRPDITKEEVHNYTHNLLDLLVEAADAGHPGMDDEMFKPIVEELRIKQKQCKEGAPKHEVNDV